MQRSIDMLSAGFLTLLEHRSTEQISIKDICEEAGVSYPTFFRRFGSKEELLEDIAAAEVRHLLALGEPTSAGGSHKRSPAAMCQYIQSHRGLWSNLLNGGASGAMRVEFMRVSKEITEEGTRINPWIPEELAIPFVTSGIFEIFAWWLRQPEDYPIRRVVALFEALIVDNTARRRDITID